MHISRAGDKCRSTKPEAIDVSDAREARSEERERRGRRGKRSGEREEGGGVRWKKKKTSVDKSLRHRVL